MTHPSAPSRAPLAIIGVGCAAILLTMLLHPTGGEAIANRDAGHAAVLLRARAVHALAIAALPLLLSGMGLLSWRLRARSVTAALAFAAWLLATGAILAAAVASGFISPALIEALPSPSSSAAADIARRAALQQQLHYTFTWNQGFSTVYVGLAALAFTAWGLAMRGSPGFPRVLAMAAPVVGLLPPLLLAVGHLRLDVGGFGLVVLLHSAWMLWAAWCLSRDAGQAPPPRAATPS